MSSQAATYGAPDAEPDEGLQTDLYRAYLLDSAGFALRLCRRRLALTPIPSSLATNPDPMPTNLTVMTALVFVGAGLAAGRQPDTW